MTLAELKELYRYVEKILSNNTKNLDEVKFALLDQFNVNDLAELPKTLKTSHNNYQDAILRLNAVYKDIGFSIEKYEKEGKGDEDEVNYAYCIPQDSIIIPSSNPVPEQDMMPYIVRSCELLPRYRIDFELSCQLANREKEFKHQLISVDDNQQSITLLSEDFSDEFMSIIQAQFSGILTTMSGEFNPKKINEILSEKLALDQIEKGYRLNLISVHHKLPQEDQLKVPTLIKVYHDDNDRENVSFYIYGISPKGKTFTPLRNKCVENINFGRRIFVSNDVNNKIYEEIKLKQGHIFDDEHDWLHRSFGIDGYAAYFDNQSIITPVRDTSLSDQNQKIDDFINLYLEKSKFPESIRLNLKALLTALPSQGAIGFALSFSFAKYFSSYGSRIINFGQDYLSHISFDKNHHIKIQVFVDQNKYTHENGIFNNVKALIKMELMIQVDVFDNVPYFTLQDTKVACNLTAPKDHSLVIGKEALKNQGDNLLSTQCDALQICTKHLAKYLGFNSLKDFYISKKGPINSLKDKNRFECLYFFQFIQMASAGDEHGKQLTKTEQKFLEWMEMAYKKQNVDAVRLSSTICQLVKNQISDVNLNKTDKLNYIYWLQLARELKGNINLKDEINETYQLLLKQFSWEDTRKDMRLLIKAAEKDVEVYQSITHPPSIFTKAIVLSDASHAKILGCYPSLLHGENAAHYVKILDSLNPQDKLQFLMKFSQNGGDVACLEHITKNFFDKASIRKLSKLVYRYNKKSFQYFDYLVTQAPANTIEYLRKPLAEVFAAYNEKIVEQPLDKLLDFLLSVNDNMLVQRFGTMFVKLLILALHGFTGSDNKEEVALVVGIAKKLAKMLNSEAELIVNSGDGELFVSLNIAYQKAKAQLRVLIPEVPQQIQDVGAQPVVVKKQNSSSSNDDLELLLSQEISGSEKLARIAKKSEALTKELKEKEIEKKPTSDRLLSLSDLSEKIVKSDKISSAEKEDNLVPIPPVHINI